MDISIFQLQIFSHSKNRSKIAFKCYLSDGDCLLSNASMQILILFIKLNDKRGASVLRHPLGV